MTKFKTCWGLELTRPKDIVFAKQHSFKLKEPLTLFKGFRYSHNPEDPILFKSYAEMKRNSLGSEGSFRTLLHSKNLERICYESTGGILKQDSPEGIYDPFVHTSLNPEIALGYAKDSNSKIHEIELPAGTTIIDISNQSIERVVLVPGQVTVEQSKGTIHHDDLKNLLVELDKRIRTTTKSDVSPLYKTTKGYRKLISRAIKKFQGTVGIGIDTIQKFLDEQVKLITKINRKLLS